MIQSTLGKLAKWGKHSLKLHKVCLFGPFLDQAEHEY